MARNLEIYPKASIEGSTWTLSMRVHEHATRTHSQFTETSAAGLTVERPLLLLKVVFDLIVADTDTDQDVADSLFVDDIRPGPQSETVWSSWQERAEGIISGLSTGYTELDFWAVWTHGDTQAMRNDAQRAMISGPGGIGRGWTITFVHQHEGDGTVTES